MYPKLFLISLWSLACLVNGQTPKPPVTQPPPVPTPSNALTMDDMLPSPDQIMAEMANNNFPPPSESELRRTRINEPGLPPRRTDGIIPRASDGTIIDPDLPLPRPGSVDPTDRPISVGNIQVIYNDELRAIMRDYEITPDEIRKMLELYAQGGRATITKRKVNPVTGLQEVITLDFDKFTTQSPNEKVTPSAPPLPENRIIPPNEGVPQTTLTDLQETERYLREQISELDAQFRALDMAYRRGEITQRTRDENGVMNREKRRRFQSDLVAIQQEIDRTTGTSKTEELMPQPFGITPREATPRGRGTTLAEEERVRQENRALEARIREMRERGAALNGRRTPTITPPLTESGRFGQRLPVNTARTNLSSLEALRRELINIRAREMNILNQLRQLTLLRNSQRLRNGRVPFGRNPPVLPSRQRINFRNSNVPQIRRTLQGSVAGQEMERRAVM